MIRNDDDDGHLPAQPSKIDESSWCVWMAGALRLAHEGCTRNVELLTSVVSTEKLTSQLVQEATHGFLAEKGWYSEPRRIGKARISVIFRKRVYLNSQMNS
jgi:hypothetical protein